MKKVPHISHAQRDEGESLPTKCTSHLPMLKFATYKIVLNSFQTCLTTLVGGDKVGSIVVLCT